jgi:alkaline phosphatase D
MRIKLLSMSFLFFFAFLLNAQEEIREKLDPALYPFYHGVASGDPLSNAVILWTRFTNDTLSSDSVKIDWRIATDTNMTNVVNAGFGYTKEAIDFTFKVDALNLQPDTYYYYDFKAQGRHSIRGRTRTAPVGDIDSVRFGIVSCSNWEHGYFSPYRHLMERNDVDYILHLGDYIYEYEVGGFSSNIAGRENVPAYEVITLEDYRLRYSHYKLDDDLRKLHQQYPFINIWDDHESANDSYRYGAGNHTPGTEGSWTDRKNNSGKAYHEWLPIRSPQPGTNRIYRAFQFGDLINLPMLDTRIEARDEQGGSAETNDPLRTLLGPVQFSWLKNNLSTSTKRWNIVGQQVMLSPMELLGVPLNYDQWDGYNYERQQLLNFVEDSAINNFVVLTGDIHTSWVHDIPLSNYNGSNCTGSAGVEFVCTSVTSTSFINFNVSQFILTSSNPHLQYSNTSKRGYAVFDVNKNRAQFDFYYMDDVEDPQSAQYYGEGYYVNNNEKCANQASGPSTRVGPLQDYAPPLPIDYFSGIDKEELIVFGVYPNPTTNKVTLQVYLHNEEPVQLKVYDMEGRLLMNRETKILSKGANYMNIDLEGLSKGTYNLLLVGKSKTISKTIVKL